MPQHFILKTNICSSERNNTTGKEKGILDLLYRIFSVLTRKIADQSWIRMTSFITSIIMMTCITIFPGLWGSETVYGRQKGSP